MDGNTVGGGGEFRSRERDESGPSRPSLPYSLTTGISRIISPVRPSNTRTLVINPAL